RVLHLRHGRAPVPVDGDPRAAHRPGPRPQPAPGRHRGPAPLARRAPARAPLRARGLSPPLPVSGPPPLLIPSPPMQHPILVGVAGGSGSGKTTVARALAASF